MTNKDAGKSDPSTLLKIVEAAVILGLINLTAIAGAVLAANALR